jgi:hypothetical protein
MKTQKKHYTVGNGLAYCGTYGGELVLHAAGATCKTCRKLLGNPAARDTYNRVRETNC